MWTAKLTKLLANGQTKYLRPSHFRKRPNFHNLAEKRPSSQPCTPVVFNSGEHLRAVAPYNMARMMIKLPRNTFVFAAYLKSGELETKNN